MEPKELNYKFTVIYNTNKIRNENENNKYKQRNRKQSGLYHWAVMNYFMFV